MLSSTYCNQPLRHIWSPEADKIGILKISTFFSKLEEAGKKNQPPLMNSFNFNTSSIFKEKIKQKKCDGNF